MTLLISAPHYNTIHYMIPMLVWLLGLDSQTSINDQHMRLPLLLCIMTGQTLLLWLTWYLIAM